MAEFQDRLSAIKEKQGAAEQKKKEEAEKVAEAARLKRETKRSELSAERDTVMAEFAKAEQTANEAREAIAQADAFATEQGENLDPEAKAEIDALKLEAGEAQQKFEEMKNKLNELNAEISAFEESGEPQEVSTKGTVEAPQGERVAEIVEQVVAPEQTQERTEEFEAQERVKDESLEQAQKKSEEVLKEVWQEFTRKTGDTSLYAGDSEKNEIFNKILEARVNEVASESPVLEQLAVKALLNKEGWPSDHTSALDRLPHEDFQTFSEVRQNMLSEKAREQLDDRILQNLPNEVMGSEPLPINEEEIEKFFENHPMSEKRKNVVRNAFELLIKNPEVAKNVAEKRLEKVPEFSAYDPTFEKRVVSKFLEQNSDKGFTEEEQAALAKYYDETEDVLKKGKDWFGDSYSSYSLVRKLSNPDNTIGKAEERFIAAINRATENGHIRMIRDNVLLLGIGAESDFKSGRHSKEFLQAWLKAYSLVENQPLEEYSQYHGKTQDWKPYYERTATEIRAALESEEQKQKAP